MPVRVRVKNFQSIEDAEIHIDGFVVICGPNNSGKTALMRAIRGLFNNAAPGSYLRQGANFLTVEIEFDDGTTILWEKGWEKPDKKGATVNRYTINGYQISSVGRGVPPEVEALGVKSILAGNNPIWPQVADQFDGTLFLVNKTGAVVAEALSDVDRVGKLTDALRLSEKDKRSSVSELKIRREDLKTFQEAVLKFQGLDQVAKRIKSLSDLKAGVLKAEQALSKTRAIALELGEATQKYGLLKDFFVDVPPEPKELRLISPRIQSLKQYHGRLKAVQELHDSLLGFQPVRISSSGHTEAKEALRVCKDFRERLTKLQNQNHDLNGAGSLSFSDASKIVKIQKVLGVIQGFKSQKFSLEKTVRDLDVEIQTVNDGLQKAEALVKSLLGTRGYCPTCNTVHISEVKAC